ncbi:MAG TPA: hypothetical protein VEI94_15430 [Candidatus Bathyarchaeia archaeon]|nr:hypothetical protein [Candidatus Bathyarchaeia archaeon]
MKIPILNHVALSLPRELVSDTPDRRSMLDFYEQVFGWRIIDVMTIEGERIVLQLHAISHFLFLVGSDSPTSCQRGDHFGIEVYERSALEQIVERARAFRAERDPRVELTEVGFEDYGTIKIHNVYVRYLLPIMVEVQFYEGVQDALHTA